MKFVTRIADDLFAMCSIAEGGGGDCLTCTLYFTVEGMKLEF